LPDIVAGLQAALMAANSRGNEMSGTLTVYGFDASTYVRTVRMVAS